MGCYNSAVIDAPVDQVWARLRNFHDVAWAEGVIEEIAPEGEPDRIGARRVLNGVFRETLLALDDHERILRYRIDDGPGPVSRDNVSGYRGEIRAWPVTDSGRTFVLWTSSWESSGGGVADFCNPIYQALLTALQRHFA